MDDERASGQAHITASPTLWVPFALFGLKVHPQSCIVSLQLGFEAAHLCVKRHVLCGWVRRCLFFLGLLGRWFHLALPHLRLNDALSNKRTLLCCFLLLLLLLCLEKCISFLFGHSLVLRRRAVFGLRLRLLLLLLLLLLGAQLHLRHLLEPLSRFRSLTILLQLRNKEPVQIVNVGQETLALCHRGMEPHVTTLCKARAPKWQASIHETHLPLLQCVVNHRFILFNKDRACGVYNVIVLGLVLAAIDGGQQQLLLQFSGLVHLLQGLGHLHLRVFGDDTRARAGGIQQHTVHVAADSRQFSAIVVDCHDIAAAQAMHIGRQGLKSFAIRIVGDYNPTVFHHLADVSRLPSRGCSDVQDFLPLFWSQRDDWEQGSCSLQHILASQILGGTTQCNCRFVYH
mmetsp:Transcript_84237/g.140474  ORF Transcript_84237/g.140474 Transcript_84237/m.140474 type:complete len:400 (-) Transcript_84237:515-1714(-)